MDVFVPATGPGPNWMGGPRLARTPFQPGLQWGSGGSPRCRRCLPTKKRIQEAFLPHSTGGYSLPGRRILLLLEHSEGGYFLHSEGGYFLHSEGGYFLHSHRS